MYRKWVPILVCAFGAVGVATADNLITVWEHTPGSTFTVNQEYRQVVITSQGAFKILATGDYNGLGDIWSITVDVRVYGEVNVYILRNPNEGGGNGAHDVRVLDLSGGGNLNMKIRKCVLPVISPRAYQSGPGTSMDQSWSAGRFRKASWWITSTVPSLAILSAKSRST